MESEKGLLICFRAMNQIGKQALLNLAKTMSKTPAFTQKGVEDASAYLDIIQAYEQVLHGDYSAFDTMIDSDL